MPPKRNNWNKGNRRRNFRRKNIRRRNNVTKAQAYRLAKKANYDMIPRKLHPFDGTTTLNDYTAPEGVLIQPTYIPGNDYVGAHQPDELKQRNGNQIYLERCSGVFNIRPFSTMLNPLHVRKICGYWKGVNGSSTDGPAAGSPLSITGLVKTFNTRLARYDSDNYLIKEDKFFTILPDQIFDENGSDDQNDIHGSQEPMRALWKPTMVKCNFNFRRKFRYNNAKQQGMEDEIETNGHNLVGWVPFILLLVQSPDQQYTATNKVDIDYKFTSYFKDVQ